MILQLHWQSCCAYFTICAKIVDLANLIVVEIFYCCMFALSCVYYNTSADQLNKVKIGDFANSYVFFVVKNFPFVALFLNSNFKRIFSLE